MGSLRNRLTLYVLVVLFVFIIAGCGKKETYVAKVNGEEITRQALDEKMQSVKNTLEMQGTKFEGDQGKALLKILEQQVLNQMIQEKILAQEADKQGIKVDEQKAQEQLDEMKNIYGADNFKSMLDQQKTTEAKLKEYILFQLTADELYKKITEDVNVTEQDAKAYFLENKEDLIKIKVSHILVKAEEGKATPEEMQKAENKAKDLIKQLQNGADFAELAKKESDEPAAKTTGGALEGYFSRSDSMYYPEFTEGALKIAKGTVGQEPVKSPYGFHVIRVEDRKEDFADVRDEVIDRLTLDKKNEKFNKYFNELMDKAEIENKLAEEAKKAQDSETNEQQDTKE